MKINNHKKIAGIALGIMLLVSLMSLLATPAVAHMPEAKPSRDVLVAARAF